MRLWGEVGRRFLSIWGATIIQTVVFLLGLLLLIVPAFIFGAWTFAMVTVVMLEGKRAGASLTRSRELASGSVLRILGTMAVAYAVYVAFSLGVETSVEFLPAMSGAGERLLAAAMDLVLALGSVFVPAVGTLLYYDLRIRKEGFEVELAAARLELASVQHTGN